MCCLSLWLYRDLTAKFQNSTQANVEELLLRNVLCSWLEWKPHNAFIIRHSSRVRSIKHERLLWSFNDLLMANLLSFFNKLISLMDIYLTFRFILPPLLYHIPIYPTPIVPHRPTYDPILPPCANTLDQWFPNWSTRTPRGTNQNTALSVHLIIPFLFNPIIGLFIYSSNI